MSKVVQVKHIESNSEEVQVRLFEQVLEDIKLGKRPKVHVFVRLANIFALIVDYPKVILQVRHLIRDRSDPVWRGLLILFPERRLRLILAILRFKTPT